LVTARGEKALVAESLRGGAADFLEKPVDLKQLRLAVARAVAQTSRQRHLAESESAVKDIGLAQKRLLDAGIHQSREILQVYYHPKHEAGGDFFMHFRPQPDQLYCLLTDVSGHDLQAAYVSAYFQGFFRGRLMSGGTMDEVCADFNRFLLEELNDTSVLRRNRSGAGVETSVAVCGLLLDFSLTTATVIMQGMPAPIYLSPEGRAEALGSGGGAPLGWFPALRLRGTAHPVVNGGSFYLWTDGLEDVAEREGVSTLSLAYAVQRAKERGERVACLDLAKDDVLLAVIHLSVVPQPERGWWPVLAEEYHGGQMGEIDVLQAYWARSLSLALPELADERQHDVLLASREIVLNALAYGCGGDPARKASFQAAYCSARRTIRVRVEDPGPGHQFDEKQHEQLLASELVDAHRGLILARHLASDLRLERSGATVVMEFGPGRVATGLEP
jgi:serine phosphatase RsbU (regulator of sigma subunit)/anti-sigma regulatory factor (Ser/Thr protein kinase)